MFIRQNLLVCALACALATPSSLEAGDVYGVVSRKGVTPEPVAAAKRYRSSGVEHAALAKAEDCNCNPSLYSVISLEGSQPYKHHGPQAQPTMAQLNKRFLPTVLAVQVGDTVDFPNSDPFFHNVFSYSKIKKFDLGRYAQGQSARVVFDKPGVAQVFCEIHASMRAYIHVFQTPFFTVSDEQGRFKLTGVPAGEYRMRVWQEGLPDLEQALKVTGDSVFVDVGS